MLNSSCLTDAVPPVVLICCQAAVESPFLENAMSSASGVLCILSLPARVLSHDFDMAPGALNDPEKYAIRAAVQVQQCKKGHASNALNLYA